MKKIAVIHGVNNPPSSGWQKDFSWLESLDAEIVFVQWPSRSFTGDGLRWLMSTAYRKQVVDVVNSAVDLCDVDLIVTHSFGQVVANAALADLPFRTEATIVNIAGPLTHPFLGVLYGSWKNVEPTRTICVLNEDDHIPALAGVWEPVEALAHIVVDVDTRQDEHDPALYLANETVQDLLRDLIC